MFCYSDKQDRKKPNKLSVAFSPLMYCLNTKLTIDSYHCFHYEWKIVVCGKPINVRCVICVLRYMYTITQRQYITVITIVN